MSRMRVVAGFDFVAAGLFGRVYVIASRCVTAVRTQKVSPISKQPALLHMVEML